MRPLLRNLFLLAATAITTACRHKPPVVPRPLFPMTAAWTTPLSAAVEGPLATDGASVYVATRDGTVRRLDAATGQIRWEAEQRPGVLAAAEGLLVVRGPQGTVWAVDALGGAVRWKVESGVPGTLPPVIYKDAVIVAGQGLAALEAASGRTRWALPEARATAVPLAWGPWLLVGESDGALRCRDLVTGAVVWSVPTARPLLAPPAVDDRGRILLGTTDRRFLSLDGTKSGRERWSWHIGGDVQAPPAVTGTLVLFTTHEDVLYALHRGNGHLAWRAPLPSRPVSGPVLYGDGVLVACYGARPNETFLIGFDVATGRRQGDLKAPGEVRAPPVVVRDLVVMGLRERAVAALRLGSAEGANP
jgi:outer membrane protein assembly factor BamB